MFTVVRIAKPWIGITPTLTHPLASVNDTDTLAIYGQVSQAVSEDVTLTLGARYEQRDVTYRDSAGVQEKFDDNYWTGNASINWQASETGAFFVTVLAVCAPAV